MRTQKVENTDVSQTHHQNDAETSPPRNPFIPYALPDRWIKYDAAKIGQALAEAKAGVIALREIPYQREWVEGLQQVELKREVAGTSRIEGAEFTERELDQVMGGTTTDLITRSQRQAAAALATYRWISSLPDDRPVDSVLVFDVHRRIVTGADDDHCPPGQLRRQDENVHFGLPRHRGAPGGEECEAALQKLTSAIQREYRDHDPLIQALAVHYHLAAMHPFLDGNGRTARALEALMLQRARLRDTCFIAMSNYYYDEKKDYLAALSAVRAAGHDLTPFLEFALRGIATQTRRLMAEISENVKKALFRNLMYDLFGLLKTPRKRVIAVRQMEILKVLLQRGSVTVRDLVALTTTTYGKLKNPTTALVRDLSGLLNLNAIDVEPQKQDLLVRIRLEWPMEITREKFFQNLSDLPQAKTHKFLRLKP